MDEQIPTKRPMSPEMYHFIASLYALLAMAAFLLNSLVILTFIRDYSLLQPTNLMVLSIAIADWLMAVVVNPMGAAANASADGALVGKRCVAYAFVTTTIGFAAILHHTAMSVERYLVVTNPYMDKIRTRSMLLVIASLWGFSILWSAFPLFGWSAYVPEGGNSVCSLYWKSPHIADEIYICAIFTFFFFLPFVIITAAYSLMHRNVNWMSRNAVNMWGPEAGPTLQIIRARTRTAKMFVMMVLGFFIGWTPYAVVSLYAVAGGADHISPALAAVPAMFAKTTIVYNPIIYFFKYERFRTSFMKSLRKIRTRVVGAPADQATA